MLVIAALVFTPTAVKGISTIENAGHWIHADAPGEFGRIVMSFLDSI